MKEKYSNTGGYSIPTQESILWIEQCSPHWLELGLISGEMNLA